MRDSSRHLAYTGGSPRSSSPAATQPFDASTTLAGTGGSPIAADKIYRARATPPLAALVTYDGSTDVRLPAGVHRLGAGCALLGEITGASAEIVVRLGARALISDCGPAAAAAAAAGGVFLGHRRERLQRHVRHALTDGRLVHLAGHVFWFRDLQHVESRSPTPPWRRSGAEENAPVGSPLLPAAHSDLEDDEEEEEDALHYLHLTQQMDALSREIQGPTSSADRRRRERERALDRQQLLLAASPPLLLPIDLQHAHAHVPESQVRLLTQEGFTQDGCGPAFGAEDSLRLDDLRVAESPRSDEAVGCEEPVEEEAEEERLAATQPVSPAQRPPDALPAGELRGAAAWLPRARPLVHAARTVLASGMEMAAYPYDFGGMQAALDRLARFAEMDATQQEACEEPVSSAENEELDTKREVAKGEPKDEPKGEPKGEPKDEPKGEPKDDRISTRIREPISAQPAPAARPRRSQQGLGQPVARQPRALRSTGSENHDMRAAAVKPSQRTRARPLNLVSTGSGGGSGGIGSGSGVPRTPRTPRTPVRLSGSPAPDGFPELAPLPSAPLSARAARPPRLPPAKQRRHTLAPPVSQQQQTQTQTQQVVEIDLSSSPMLPAPEALLGLAVADDDDDGRLPAEGAHEAIQAPVVVLRPPPLQKPRRITRRTSASLRDSLSRLPGAKGVARTQLTSKRRRVLAHQDTPPRLPSPGAADPGDPADPVDPADPADAVDSAGSVDPRGSAELAPPPSPPPTTAPTTAPTTPLPTRFTLATLTGFASAAEQRRATQQLRSRRTISVTDDPMLADVCVSGGPLARKLKVLCALARGTPLVDVRWIADTESGDPVDDYVPESPDVEALWGVSVRETLARARRGADEGCRLLAGFCVHIDESVAEARDISVLACAAGAYVLGVTRPGRRGSAEPHESLALEPAGWSTAGTLSDGSSGSGSSSTEPDDDADSDWDAKADGRVQRPRGRRRPRKTLPRLSVRPKLQREPSLVLAAPAAVSRSTSATSTASLAKRRRIDSPRLESAEGALALVEMLKRQRVELGVPPEARLLVVVEELRAPRGVREQWVVGGALVVAPEDIIQSVLHCELTFLP